MLQLAKNSGIKYGWIWQEVKGHCVFLSSLESFIGLVWRQTSDKHLIYTNFSLNFLIWEETVLAEEQCVLTQIKAVFWSFKWL